MALTSGLLVQVGGGLPLPQGVHGGLVPRLEITRSVLPAVVQCRPPASRVLEDRSARSLLRDRPWLGNLLLRPPLVSILAKLAARNRYRGSTGAVLIWLHLTPATIVVEHESLFMRINLFVKAKSIYF